MFQGPEGPCSLRFALSREGKAGLSKGDILEIAHEAYFFCLFSEFELV